MKNPGNRQPDGQHHNQKITIQREIIFLLDEIGRERDPDKFARIQFPRLNVLIEGLNKKGERK